MREIRLPAWLLSGLIWSIVVISFRPFAVVVEDDVAAANSGDLVNQIGFGIIGIVCATLLYKRSNLETVSATLKASWFATLAVLLLSILHADDPNGAFRAVAFSLIVVLAAFTAMALLEKFQDFSAAMALLVVAALAYCYLAVFFVPEQGVHGSGGFEGQHAGLWRGIFDHKNVATYVMGGFAIISLFLVRSGRWLMGLVLFALSVVFVVNGGSKTVLGILPAALIFCGLAQWVTWPLLRIALLLLPLVSLVAVTLGAVIYTPVLEWLREFIPGLSYTGRTELWIFGLDHLQPVFWTGYGFESFWGTERVAGLEQPIELSWDVRGIVHGHNSWLDAAIGFGVPGALIVFFFVAIVPLRDYLRIPQSGNAGKLAGLFITLWLFTALGANLESFFFRRADPVWFLMLISIVGLRLTAHHCHRKATAHGHKAS